MEHEIQFGKFQLGKWPTFLDFPLFPGIFQWEELTKRFPFSTKQKFPKIMTKWKAPKDFSTIPQTDWQEVWALSILRKNPRNFGGSKSGISYV